jgi:hypothetical protein
MPTKVPNRTQRTTANQNLIDGLKKHQDTLPSLVIDGTSYKTADIITTLQGFLNSAATVVSSRATWQAAVQADEQGREKGQTFVSGLKQALHVAFGNSIDMLADFGLVQRKTRAPRTPQQKAASAAKAKATRAARHTMGSKQKTAIKGSVTPPATVDGQPAPAPTASAAPAVAPAHATAPAAPTPAVAPTTTAAVLPPTPASTTAHS